MIEQTTMKEIDARVASERGFYTATSNMTNQHDESVSNMKKPELSSFEENVKTIKQTKELENINQTIQNQKNEFEVNKIKENADLFLNKEKQSLKNSKSKTKEEFEKIDKESILTRTRRGFSWWDYKKPSDEK